MVKLGILVNSAKHLQHVVGMTHAALAGGREVIVFAMDEGTLLLEEDTFISLASLAGVTMSVCEHSAKAHGVAADRLPPQVRCGSQLDNAMMAREADRIVVL